MTAADEGITGAFAPNAPTAPRCKKCGAGTRELRAVTFRSLECVACHFVVIETVPVAGRPATDGRQQ